MKQLKQFFILVFLSTFLNSCGIFQVQNPRKPGKYPEFDRETILLGELTPIRKNFDVTFYDLDIKINHITKELSGWVEIQAIAIDNIDSIQLDLDQPLIIEGLHWKTRGGINLEYEREERAIYIKLPERIKAGHSFSVHIKYKGKPIIAKRPPWKGGLVWEKDKQKKPWIGVVCESEGSSIWFPCKDHTSDEPDSVTMRFTILDTTLFVVSNGRYLGSDITKGHRSFRWKVSYPINLYNITFYIGDYQKIEDSLVGINSNELLITYYALKYHIEKATKYFPQVKEHIKVYEELYGEYPWYNDGFKLVEAPYAGMEHQTAIAFGNMDKKYFNETDDHIILHETGHEWFGNAITASDFCDIWLQEGFTTYGESIYFEKKYGYKDALAFFLFHRSRIKNKRPVVGPPDRRFYNFHDVDVYFKGAWILHSLRTTINNDSLFFLTIRSFYNENKLKVTNSQAFIEIVNRITNKDYTWFFEQYLYQNKVPILEYKYTDEGVLYYRWVDVSEGFTGLPVLIKFSNETDYSVIYPKTEVQIMKNPEKNNLPSTVEIDNGKVLFGIKKNKKLSDIYEKEVI